MLELSYDDIVEECKKLAKEIKKLKLKNPQIVGVSRGGLIPTTIIAEMLGYKDIRIIKLSSYEGKEKSEIKDLSTDTIIGFDDPIIIDDLIDSGDSVKYIQKLYPCAKICTLYHKRDDIKVWYNGKKIDEKEWVKFPWEFSQC